MVTETSSGFRLFESGMPSNLNLFQLFYIFSSQNQIVLSSRCHRLKRVANEQMNLVKEEILKQLTVLAKFLLWRQIKNGGFKKRI